MAAKAPTTLVEDFRPFVESKLWELQRQYFAARGQQAWSAGEVPHYITSNPVVAAAYAEVLVAFRRDRLRRDPAEEALWIVELGAGSGRFAHHLLQQLGRHAAAAPPLPHRVQPLQRQQVLRALHGVPQRAVGNVQARGRRGRGVALRGGRGRKKISTASSAQASGVSAAGSVNPARSAASRKRAFTRGPPRAKHWFRRSRSCWRAHSPRVF